MHWSQVGATSKFGRAKKLKGPTFGDDAAAVHLGPGCLVDEALLFVELNDMLAAPFLLLWELSA